LFLSGTVGEIGRWYSDSRYFRDQTDAFMQGRLALSTNAAQLGHDLCWSEGGVHQVWGLGIPLWRFPWELGARLVGMEAFPDWFALGIGIAVAAYLTLRSLNILEAAPTPLNILSRDKIVALLVLLAFPPVINLLRARMQVYEEVLAYEYFFGLVVLAGLARWSLRPSRRTLWALCLAAGLGGLVRPTLGPPHAGLLRRRHPGGYPPGRSGQEF
jgi:hypothetical protein